MSMSLSIYALFMQSVFSLSSDNLIDTGKLVFWTCQKFSLRVLLSFCLIFCKSQPAVAYKSVAYKKSEYTLFSDNSIVVCKIKENISEIFAFLLRSNFAIFFGKPNAAFYK